MTNCCESYWVAHVFILSTDVNMTRVLSKRVAMSNETGHFYYEVTGDSMGKT